MEECIHAFLTSAKDGDEWSASLRNRFKSGSNCIPSWVSATAGLDAVEKRKIYFLCQKSNLDSAVV
jgi:hypothetical protein